MTFKYLSKTTRCVLFFTILNWLWKTFLNFFIPPSDCINKRHLHLSLKWYYTKNKNSYKSYYTGAPINAELNMHYDVYLIQDPLSATHQNVIGKGDWYVELISIDVIISLLLPVLRIISDPYQIRLTVRFKSVKLLARVQYPFKSFHHSFLVSSVGNKEETHRANNLRADSGKRYLEIYR